MPDFVVIFGPSAVGKMAVGRELAEQTGYRLFHNHQTIELVRLYFPHGPIFSKLVAEFRRRLIEEVAASDLPGLIFTYVWGLDQEGDRREIDGYAARFGRCFYVELEADLETRLERNRSELRLQEKPSKRNLEWSERDLRKQHERFRMNTEGDFFYPDRHLKLNNTGLPAGQAAERIASWLQTFP